MIKWARSNCTLNSGELFFLPKPKFKQIHKSRWAAVMLGLLHLQDHHEWGIWKGAAFILSGWRVSSEGGPVSKPSCFWEGSRHSLEFLIQASLHPVFMFLGLSRAENEVFCFLSQGLIILPWTNLVLFSAWRKSYSSAVLATVDYQEALSSFHWWTASPRPPPQKKFFLDSATEDAFTNTGITELWTLLQLDLDKGLQLNAHLVILTLDVFYLHTVLLHCKFQFYTQI